MAKLTISGIARRALACGLPPAGLLLAAPANAARAAWGPVVKKAGMKVA